VSTRQNCYTVIDTDSSTENSHGTIVAHYGGLDVAINAARKRGPGSAIVHCSTLLSSAEDAENSIATKEFYSLVTTDMRGFPLIF
jgi:hypothetical protein